SARLLRAQVSDEVLRAQREALSESKVRRDEAAQVLADARQHAAELKAQAQQILDEARAEAVNLLDARTIAADELSRLSDVITVLGTDDDDADSDQENTEEIPVP